MIPPDVASSLRLVLPDTSALQNQQTAPVAGAQRLADVLSDLVPGQRIMAEIQALLPNGNYRAVVAQRDVTLALPFSAKAGDMLELEVTESNGKLTLAFVTDKTEGKAARPGADSATSAQAPAAKVIGNLLSGLSLVPGQRIQAEIQSLLSNGNYRATIAQREFTLALPVSAKAGDTIELEVTESNGTLTLGFVSNKTEATTAKPSAESVTTFLSSAGKVIGNLLNELSGDGKRAPPTPLNGNQALVESMPKLASDLAPVLKQALTQSGMFYEAHQARWVAGNLPAEALRQEPQAKHAMSLNAAVDLPKEAKITFISQGAFAVDGGQVNTRAEAATAVISSPSGAQTSQAGSAYSTNPVPNDLRPLVQQQLDGLANQNFAWQGQIWPGQPMWWEISKNPDEGKAGQNEAAQWQTRLKLSLPSLGDIDLSLRLRAGGEIAIAATTTSENSEQRLRESANALCDQFAAAGLTLSNLLVKHEQQTSE